MVNINNFFKKKSFYRLSFIIFILLILILFFNFYFLGLKTRSRAVGERVQIIFTPDNINQSNQNSFSLQIKGKPLDSNNNPLSIVVRGYKFEVSFNKDNLQLNSITYPANCPEVSGLATSTSQANETGLIRVFCANTSTTGYILPADYSVLLELNFTPKRMASSVITLDSSKIGFSKINSDGSLEEIPSSSASNISVNVNIGTSSLTPSPTPTPTSRPTPTSNPTPTSITPTSSGGQNLTLNLKLKFQGVTNPVTTRTWRVRVGVGGSNLSQPVYQSADFSYTNNRVWEGSVNFNLNPGNNYYLLIKGPKHLQKKVCSNSPLETYPGSYRCVGGQGNVNLMAENNNLNLSNIYLLAGDLDQDGVVTAYDVSLIRLNLGKTDEATLRLADLNLDGRVDTQDYSLVIAALSVRADEE